MHFKSFGRAFHHLGPTTEMDLSASLVWNALLFLCLHSITRMIALLQPGL